MGIYWQWGNLTESADGPVGPGTGNSQTNEDTTIGWVNASAPNDSWLDASKTGNDPCPPGFRVPTKDQWNGVLIHNLVSNAPGSTWIKSISNYTSGKKFGSYLMLPASGWRDGDPTGSKGALDDRGNTGQYWSSTEQGSINIISEYLFFDNNQIVVGQSFRNNGHPVRCIAE